MDGDDAPYVCVNVAENAPVTVSASGMNVPLANVTAYVDAVTISVCACVAIVELVQLVPLSALANPGTHTSTIDVSVVTAETHAPLVQPLDGHAS